MGGLRQPSRAELHAALTCGAMSAMRKRFEDTRKPSARRIVFYPQSLRVMWEQGTTEHVPE